MRRLDLPRPRLPLVVRNDSGQSVVIVALMFTILMAGAAMSIDVGRFYAERRFIQSAVDAASLACGISYSRTGDAATAWNAGDRVLQDRNLRGNPLGLTITYAPRGSETYDNNVVSPQNLNSGILPVSSPATGCRVAITVAVPTYLIKIVSPSLNTISMTTRAYAKAKGGFLPSVVKRYLNPGDTDDVDNASNNEFLETTATAATNSLCHAGSNYAPGCIAATTTTPGEEIVLFGASQKASNDPSFRGYIGLDIRNFSDENPPGSGIVDHTGWAFNGVAPDVTVNTLKDYEARWIAEGYPGPDICVVDTSDFEKCAQIAVINGSSSGIFVDYYRQWFRVGDIAMFQLYDGTVKRVPDFAFTPPTLQVPTNGSIPPVAVAYSMSAQFAASTSSICAEVVLDDGTLTKSPAPGDPTGTNPFNTGAISMSGIGTCVGTAVGNFSSNPTPVGVSTYNQTLSGMSSAGAQKGIYQVFIRGTASAPYSARVHYLPVKVVVGGQTTEYRVNSSETQKSVSIASLPATVSWNAVIATGTGATQWKTSGASADGPVTVSWESCPRSDDPTPTILACYIDTVGTTSKVVTAGTTVPMTVQTSGVATQKTYKGWVRTLGRDSFGNPVTRLWEVRLDVDQQLGGTTEYVDVIGYAAFEITNIDANDVYGRAVSGAYLDPNDPALAIAKRIVLVPWETP